MPGNGRSHWSTADLTVQGTGLLCVTLCSVAASRWTAHRPGTAVLVITTEPAAPDLPAWCRPEPKKAHWR
ncbi:hypothetical protein [Streptomyces sp. Tu 3180]|uniref:hypothetical protein n=1 Tax=Streptomyces sp. Tu 3180 TaxID=2682611 RepID=UPI00135A1BBC|nr:hypothetical protein [Streptomyces sp. Tu 3180]KAF3468822.1 hypothetical protein GL259_34130 [Streptomyces sp. Tu 3180]